MEQAKVAISSDFLTAFARLPRNVQGKVTEFINKFRSNPNHPGINYEKIEAASDEKICSVRIDNTYRGIVARQKEGNIYLLLWVDHHDEAYTWAKRKKCMVNRTTGAIQVYETITTVEHTTVAAKDCVFGRVSDDELLQLGVPSEQIDFLRSLVTAEEFRSHKAFFSCDVYEALTWIAEGFEAPEVIEMLQDQRKQIETDNLAAAIDTPLTLQSFIVPEDENELRRIMAEPLEKWRVFLHPTQRALVKKNYSGSARVLGGAGTGKTVVAMHRAKYLASKLADNERILFTTFTANLAADIRENLKKICTQEEMRRIEVIHLDAWVSAFLNQQNYSFKVIYGSDFRRLLQAAIDEKDLNMEFSLSFYEEEWIRVVAAQEAFSADKYLRASRIGRGTRLDRKKRVQIWKVFEAFQNKMNAAQVRDVYSAMYECKTLLIQHPPLTSYRHIIVDEAQDFSPNAFRLLRSIAGEEHPNDLFIVGDAHQRIYKNRTVLSQCGISVRGRSRMLRVNYRTTEEIRTAAFAILKGIAFDDLDGAEDSGDRCRSLTHGEKPIRLFCKDENDEFSQVLSQIKQLTAAGVSMKDICIVARTKKIRDSFQDVLTDQGYQSYSIQQDRIDDRNIDGLRLATMHRVKGLEFPYVFIVSVNEHIVPLDAAIDRTDKISEMETMTAERCLLYVALTRAQKGVYISCYGEKSSFL